MKKIFLLTFLGLIIMLCATNEAFACKCVANQSQKSLYRNADAVVVAEVVAVETLDAKSNTVKATLKVEKSWKTKVDAETVVVTGETCAFEFVEGAKYVLFLSKSNANGFSTSICAGNQKYDEASRMRRWLGRYGKAR